MRKLFSPNGAFPNKAVIVGAALAVVVALSYFGSSDYLNQSIMDMLMGGTHHTDCAQIDCGALDCTPTQGSCDESCDGICEVYQDCSSDCTGQCNITSTTKSGCDKGCQRTNCDEDPT